MRNTTMEWFLCFFLPWLPFCEDRPMSWNSVVAALEPTNWYKLDDQSINTPTEGSGIYGATADFADAQGNIDLYPYALVYQEGQLFRINQPGPILSQPESQNIGIRVGSTAMGVGREDGTWQLPATDEFTLAYWVKQTGSLSAGAFTSPGVAQGSGVDSIGLVSPSGVTDVVWLTRGSSAIVTGSGAPSQEWAFYALTRNSSDVFTVYLNGAVMAVSEAQTGWSITDSGLTIFSLTYHTDDQFVGYLDEIMLWKGTALTAAQILSLYNAAVSAPLLLQDTTPAAASASQGIPILTNYNFSTPKQTLAADGTPE